MCFIFVHAAFVRIKLMMMMMMIVHAEGRLQPVLGQWARRRNQSSSLSLLTRSPGVFKLF